MKDRTGSSAFLFKSVLIALAVAGTSAITAQSTPVPTNTAPGLESTTPPPYPPEGVENKVSQQNSAWKRFDAATTRDINLSNDQLDRIRDLDDRYERRYRDLGPDPLNAPGYRDLYDERDQEIRGVLTPEQYERWNSSTTPVYGEDITPP